ncbi:MAG: type II toxin-antitoxin system RelE/ParE family toxin [Candidatus Kapabacteria bacterium]|nr:type II toxin-antitoxin system RelE/ParE family toxin [Candidatus Kapabacteria bacterium]
MAKVKWTKDAVSDLRRIAEYIEVDSYKYSIITIKFLFDSTKILEHSPNAGRVVPEFRNETIRELIRGNYRVVYKITNKERIDILTVHHSKRLLSNNPLLEEYY